MGILVAVVVTAAVCAALAWADAELFTVIPRERTRRRVRVNLAARRLERADRKRKPEAELGLTRDRGDRRILVAGVIRGRN